MDYLRRSQYPKDAKKNKEKKREATGGSVGTGKRRRCVERGGASRQWITSTEQQQQQIISSCHDCCLGKCFRVYMFTKVNIHVGHSKRATCIVSRPPSALLFNSRPAITNTPLFTNRGRAIGVFIRHNYVTSFPSPY